jgi:glycerol-3-phosphate cytidylyltransferase
MIKVYTAGTWDLFHIGHLNILRQAKELGDYLIVGVSTDELIYSYKNHYPVIPFKDRLELIKACKYVDEVVVQNTLLEESETSLINPNIIVLGSDWKNKFLPGREYIKSSNIQLVYFEYTDSISSTWIRNRLEEIYK